MAEPFLGEMSVMSFGFAPRGFATCDGQLLQISQNQALFSILGTTYGGDGRTTFGLPDMRGRVPIHWGNDQQGNVVLGQKGGEPTHTLIQSEMPKHDHPLIGAKGPAAAQRGAANNYYGLAERTGSAVSLYAPGAPAAPLNAGVVGPSGGNQPHANMQPYLALNFVIALVGIFPSRT